MGKMSLQSDLDTKVVVNNLYFRASQMYLNPTDLTKRPEELYCMQDSSRQAVAVEWPSCVRTGGKAPLCETRGEVAPRRWPASETDAAGLRRLFLGARFGGWTGASASSREGLSGGSWICEIPVAAAAAAAAEGTAGRLAAVDSAEVNNSSTS